MWAQKTLFESHDFSITMSDCLLVLYLIILHLSLVPGKIAKISVVPRDETSMIVSWVLEVNLNIPPVQSFKLQYKEVSSDVYSSVSIDRSARSFVVTNLQPNNAYEFTISAVNKMGVGPRSDQVLAFVKPRPTGWLIE